FITSGTSSVMGASPLRSLIVSLTVGEKWRKGLEPTLVSVKLSVNWRKSDNWLHPLISAPLIVVSGWRIKSACRRITRFPINLDVTDMSVHEADVVLRVLEKRPVILRSCGEGPFWIMPGPWNECRHLR